VFHSAIKVSDSIEDSSRAIESKTDSLKSQTMFYKVLLGETTESGASLMPQSTNQVPAYEVFNHQL
jgi:hypothetical protein